MNRQRRRRIDREVSLSQLFTASAIIVLYEDFGMRSAKRLPKFIDGLKERMDKITSGYARPSDLVEKAESYLDGVIE